MLSRRPWLLLGLVGGFVLLVVVALLVLVPRGFEPDEPPPSWSEPTELPPAVAPYGTPAAQLVDPDWLDEVATTTAIPPRALAAYAGVSVFQSEFRPDCGLSWTILAAIGYVESRHGTHGGSSVQHDGTVVPPIYGIPLAGGETDLIPDSDEGAIDGDAEYDRAMGPLQMIPESWRNWAYDGNHDGITDPQNIDDAAHAAANYLCRASSAGLDTEEGWREGVSAYNSNPAYIVSVAIAAERYRLAAEQLSGDEG